MASSVLRRAFRTSSAGIIISRRIPSLCGGHSPRCAISRCCWSKLRGDDRMMSTTASDDNTPPLRTSPWLMLPPAASEGGGGIVYKFYSLAERKVLSINKRRQSESEGGGGIVKKIYSLVKRKFLNINNENLESDAECVGSSHGWIALFNRRNNDLFLWNPLSGRHIKLPSMERVEDGETTSKWGPAKVLKLVLSSSPEEEGCRAMMMYGPLNRLAFCSPGDTSTSSEWTPVGRRFCDDFLRERQLTGRSILVHEDLAFCKSQRWFSTIDAFQHLHFDLRFGLNYLCFCLGDLTSWEAAVDDAHAPTHTFHYYINANANANTNHSTACWEKENMALLKHKCLQIPHIVHMDNSDQVYIVFQFVMPMNPDDPTTPVDRLPSLRFVDGDGYYPSKTVGFVVVKRKANGLDNEIVDDLDGLAMFVGINNSFALPASDFPELKPDSIYFTDAKRIVSIDGRNDFGIFDYRNKIVHGIDIFQGNDMDYRSSSPGPGQVKRPSPVWFTPA